MEKLIDKWKPNPKRTNIKILPKSKIQKVNKSYYYAYGTGPHTEGMIEVLKSAFFA